MFAPNPHYIACKICITVTIVQMKKVGLREVKTTLTTSADKWQS